MGVGFTGKLPAYGDFVQGGGSREACRNWADWAERGLAATRDVSGFHDTFLTSPIWRFAVSPQIFGPNSIAGVFCPSMDKVGRLFPFAIIAETPPEASLVSVCAGLDQWFADLENTILLALEPEATVENLSQSISEPSEQKENGAVTALANSPSIATLDVTADGRITADTSDLLDLTDAPVESGDGIWITLGGVDTHAHGIKQFGIATDTLFARLVVGEESHCD